MKFRILLSTLALSICSLASAAPMSVDWSVNGHKYKIVDGFYGTWNQANATLEDGWYLATITSAEEQNFIMNSFAQYLGEFWLGGYQADEADRFGEAEQNWHWVTGETWDYNNWASWEPNEWGGYVEDHLGIWNNNASWNWLWNDEHGNSNISGYVAEYGSVDVPEPGTLGLIASGLIGLILLRRKSA